MTSDTSPCVQWAPVDIAFQASDEETNPYPRHHDPYLQVTFRSQGNRHEITLEGFWDGGRDWLV
jgi:hypothetical protein